MLLLALKLPLHWNVTNQLWCGDNYMEGEEEVNGQRVTSRRGPQGGVRGSTQRRQTNYKE